MQQVVPSVLREPRNGGQRAVGGPVHLGRAAGGGRPHEREVRAGGVAAPVEVRRGLLRQRPRRRQVPTAGGGGDEGVVRPTAGVPGRHVLVGHPHGRGQVAPPGVRLDHRLVSRLPLECLSHRGGQRDGAVHVPGGGERRPEPKGERALGLVVQFGPGHDLADQVEPADVERRHPDPPQGFAPLTGRPDAVRLPRRTLDPEGRGAQFLEGRPGGREGVGGRASVGRACRGGGGSLAQGGQEDHRGHRVGVTGCVFGDHAILPFVLGRTRAGSDRVVSRLHPGSAGPWSPAAPGRSIAAVRGYAGRRRVVVPSRSDRQPACPAMSGWLVVHAHFRRCASPRRWRRVSRTGFGRLRTSWPWPTTGGRRTPGEAGGYDTWRCSAACPPSPQPCFSWSACWCGSRATGPATVWGGGQALEPRPCSARAGWSRSPSDPARSASQRRGPTAAPTRPSSYGPLGG